MTAYRKTNEYGREPYKEVAERIEAAVRIRRKQMAQHYIPDTERTQTVSVRHLSLICFSLTGWATGCRLAEKMRACGYEASLEGKSRYLPESMDESVSEWTKRQFSFAQGIIFIGACGIAVRSIAPFVASKTCDPAVLVIDECGSYVISLLSGHLGGANELAQEAAAALGALPVITTATDLHNRFAVDVFAKRNGCAIFHMKAAKEVSAALLAGEKVGFYSEYPWDGALPKGLTLCGRDGRPIEDHSDKGYTDSKKDRACGRFSLGIAVTIHRSCLPFDVTVQVVPKIAALGMGCRRGREEEAVCAAAYAALREEDIYEEAVFALASHELKSEETGLKALSEKWNVSFLTFSPEELLQVLGDFTSSDFVEKVTGVDNVCERSAVCACGDGVLTAKKRRWDGVTTAVAEKKWRIHFE